MSVWRHWLPALAKQTPEALFRLLAIIQVKILQEPFDTAWNCAVQNANSMCCISSDPCCSEEDLEWVWSQRDLLLWAWTVLLGQNMNAEKPSRTSLMEMELEILEGDCLEHPLNEIRLQSLAVLLKTVSPRQGASISQAQFDRVVRFIWTNLTLDDSPFRQAMVSAFSK